MPSTASARELGRRGERLAATYLEERGWKVVGTGFLARRGEVDLVCRKGDYLVLVEVKTRTGLGFAVVSLLLDREGEVLSIELLEDPF